MWQSPNQRVGAGKKQGRSRSRRPIHIRRALGELKLLCGTEDASTVTAEARIILNDLSAGGVGVFLHQAIAVGQQVGLTLSEPGNFFVKGRVVWCQQYNLDSKVLSDSAFTYRAGIEFTFENEEEANQAKAYCDELTKFHLPE